MRYGRMTYYPAAWQSPVDQAFPESELVALTERPAETETPTIPWAGSMLISTLVVSLVLLSIVFLRNILSALPPIGRSLTRSRGPFNLESSIRSSRDRNILAMLLFLPMAMVLSRYRVWNPDFAAQWSDEGHLALCTAALLLYAGLRSLLCLHLRGRRINADSYHVANRFAFTYFIVIASVSLALVGSLSYLEVAPERIREILLLVLTFLFGIFLIRKWNLFHSFCGPFISFLYLCGLEILPMAALVAISVIF